MSIIGEHKDSSQSMPNLVMNYCMYSFTKEEL